MQNMAHIENCIWITVLCTDLVVSKVVLSFISKHCVLLHLGYTILYLQARPIVIVSSRHFVRNGNLWSAMKAKYQISWCWKEFMVGLNSFEWNSTNGVDDEKIFIRLVPILQTNHKCNESLTGQLFLNKSHVACRIDRWTRIDWYGCKHLTYKVSRRTHTIHESSTFPGPGRNVSKLKWNFSQAIEDFEIQNDTTLKSAVLTPNWTPRETELLVKACIVTVWKHNVVALFWPQRHRGRTPKGRVSTCSTICTDTITGELAGRMIYVLEVGV